jgi:hypothetical protein
MAKKRGPKSDASRELRDSSLIVGCRTEWKDWVLRFSKKERIAPAQLADQGLANLARDRGFEPPPDR